MEALSPSHISGKLLGVPMKARVTKVFSQIDIRVVLWGIIAIYTLLLPNAIVVYRTLVKYIGQTGAGKIPLISILVFGSAYAWYGYRKTGHFKHLWYLMPSGLIALAIIQLEANPNKHIHIPEYVLMAWLLYAVLSKDYKGSGIFALIMLCGSFMGVVDELEQGIHPRRFYGWSDMLVNSASTLIGIFTLLGVARRSTRDWGWRLYLSDYKHEISVLIFGLSGAIFMSAQLFFVQTYNVFWGAYPRWLFTWNILFIANLLILLYRRWRIFWQHLPNSLVDDLISVNASAITARLWIYPLLTIVAFMHALVVFVALFGLSFR
jgi:VanZ family protein